MTSQLAERILRKFFPDSTVKRRVQGVELFLPRSHRLPDYARNYPEYGQNLVRLCAELPKDCVSVVDVGANVGDSALQILQATKARILCVEGDSYWLTYLKRNVSGNDNVSIEGALLSGGHAEGSLAPVRESGTTRFEPGSSKETRSAISADELLNRHPEFESVDIIKCDTDGYDVELIPPLAKAWQESRPILFFEYDVVLAERVGISNPAMVWQQLEELGYARVAVWSNYGHLIGLTSVTEMPNFSRLVQGGGRPDFDYMDVAVAHAEDLLAVETLNAMARS